MKESFLKVLVDGNYALWIEKINVIHNYKSLKEKDKLKNAKGGAIKCHLKCMAESFLLYNN